MIYIRYSMQQKIRIEIPARGKPITDSKRVDDVVKKFRSKYGEEDMKKYYTKFDVAVEVPL